MSTNSNSVSNVKLYASKKTHKTKISWQCLNNCKFLINKRSYTYIHLFVGNREVLGAFLVLTLNLLAGLTPSVEIKPFRKLKFEVVRITYVVQSHSL